MAQAGRLARLARMPARTLVPPLCRLVGGGIATNASLFWGGRMRVQLPEAISTHIYRFGFFERDVCEFLLSNLREGMRFVDIGAHFGFFTLLGSRLVGREGRVVAVEPMPATSAALRANIAAHAPFPNVRSVELAAFDSETVLRLADYGTVQSAYNTAFAMRGAAAAAADAVEVRARPLDALIEEGALDRVDLVKIDVESSEARVLDGMRRILGRCRPTIVMEVGDFDLAGVPPSRALVDRLLDIGYRAFEWSDGIRPHRPRGRYGYANLLFRPAERA